MLTEGADINARDTHGQNALMLSARAGQLPMVQVLLSHGTELDRTAKHGLSALMLAILGGHQAVVCRLIDAGADCEIRGSGAPGFSGKSALDLAQVQGLTRVIARLAHAHGRATEDANESEPEDWQPYDVVRIHDAFCRGDLQALHAALKDPRAIPNGRMPDAIGPCLIYAIYHSPPAFVRTMLDLGAAMDGPYLDGFPPLIAALSNPPQRANARRTTEMITLLLKSGADPDQRGLNDYTPLHMAAGMGNQRAVDLLLEAGADPRLRTRIDEYETARDIATTAGHDDIACVLAQWDG